MKLVINATRLKAGRGQMVENKGFILIAFAWIMEVIGVAGGVLNSAYTTFGEDLPLTLSGYLPALPLAALAVAELGRVPLASVVFHRHKMMQAVALVGILALGYLAVENWTFGFERIVDLRLKSVSLASRALNRAEAELSELHRRREQRVATEGSKREELRLGISQRDASIAGLTAQLEKEGQTHQQNLAQIREACRLIKERCMVPRSQQEDERFAGAVTHLNSELTRQRQERLQFQAQLDQLVSRDAADAAALDRETAIAGDKANELRQVLHAAVDHNQIYRLAASWYGVNTSDVTPEQFAKARLVFSTFSAVAVALAGSVAALVFYASTRTPGAPSTLATGFVRLIRARRAYYARKRKPIVRELPGPEREVFREGPPPPIVIEKEVTRFVDRIVLIPRFGIRVPFYVNRLIRGEASPPTAVTEEAAANSNVTSFNKRAG